jgi:hypothetical protein
MILQMRTGLAMMYELIYHTPEAAARAYPGLIT